MNLFWQFNSEFLLYFVTILNYSKKKTDNVRNVEGVWINLDLTVYFLYKYNFSSTTLYTLKLSHQFKTPKYRWDKYSMQQ